MLFYLKILLVVKLGVFFMIKLNLDDFCADFNDFCSDAGIYLDCCEKCRENGNEHKCETKITVEV